MTAVPMKEGLDLQDPELKARTSNLTFCGSSIWGGSRRQRETVDQLDISTEFANLSLLEREAVLEELHGVVPDTLETPENRAMGLAQMREELAKIPVRKKRAFTKAAFLRPSLESDDAFFLRFLRAERYDPKEAASKLCLLFDAKLELFPPEKLHRRITLDDLDDDDMASMMQNSFQPLSSKDQAGRTI